MHTALQVVDLVKQLLRSSKVSVTTSDIGIVAAFRVQVLRLRRLLRDRGYGNVNVGQVEDFQGNEHKVSVRVSSSSPLSLSLFSLARLLIFFPPLSCVPFRAALVSSTEAPAFGGVLTVPFLEIGFPR